MELLVNYLFFPATDGTENEDVFILKVRTHVMGSEGEGRLRENPDP